MEEAAQQATGMLAHLAADQVERLDAVGALVELRDAGIADQLLHAVLADEAMSPELLITHNVWAPDWRALITLIGWIAGTARIALPATMKRVGEAMLDKPVAIAAPDALMAIIGGYLSWKGYLA